MFWIIFTIIAVVLYVIWWNRFYNDISEDMSEKISEKMVEKIKVYLDKNQNGKQEKSELQQLDPRFLLDNKKR